MRRLVVLLPLLLPALASAQARDIAVQLQNALDRVSAVAAETFGRSLPLPSASAGVSYVFDPARSAAGARSGATPCSRSRAWWSR